MMFYNIEKGAQNLLDTLRITDENAIYRGRNVCYKLNGRYWLENYEFIP